MTRSKTVNAIRPDVGWTVMKTAKTTIVHGVGPHPVQQGTATRATFTMSCASSGMQQVSGEEVPPITDSSS